MSSLDQSRHPELGYWFSPKSHSNSPGYPGLNVAIYNTASNMHFDPKVIQVPVFTDIDRFHPHGIENMKVFHPWPYRAAYHVAPGMLIISDRNDKKIEAFTFGGKLKINVSTDYTKCLIESDAPIIEASATNVLAVKLLEEAEILLAERRAVWAQDENEFSARLESVPSDILYAACLQEFQDRIDQSPNKEIQTIQDFRNFIATEIRDLVEEERWPEKVPSISEIL